MAMVEPEIESAPWEERRDGTLRFTSSRSSISSLIRASIAASSSGPGSPRTARSAASRRSWRATHRKGRVEALALADEPIGAHLTASREEIVRIYSTSGTTGTPSYIPLTAADLEVWVRTSARSYAASGLEPGERIVSTYNAGPSSPARPSAPSTGSGSAIFPSARATPSG